jgi:AraC-like DNA-binding protein
MLRRTGWNTSDVEKATDAFSQTFGNTKIEIHERSSVLDVQFDVISLGNVSLIRNRMGPEVTLVCEGTRDFLLTIPLKGRSTFEFNGETIVCNKRRGMILSPVRNLSIHRSLGSENAVVKLDCKAVETALTSLVARKLNGPILFEPLVDIRTGIGASLRRYVLHLFNDINNNDSGMAIPEVANAASRALITEVLFMLRHNYSEMLTGPGKKPLMPEVRRVEEYIEANFHRVINDRQLADFSGSSASTLYRTFMKYRGYTPIQFLRQVRMRRARKLLLSPGAHGTVTSIALDCGFTHFSRFAGEYRRQYGESPSATLRKNLSH